MTLPKTGFDFADAEARSINKNKTNLVLPAMSHGLEIIYSLNSFDRSSPKTVDAVNNPENRALETPTVVIS